MNTLLNSARQIRNPREFNRSQKLFSAINWLLETLKSLPGRIYESSLRSELLRQGLTLHQTAKLVWNPEHGGLTNGTNVYLGVYSVMIITNDHRGGAGNGEIHLGNDIYIGDHCNIRAAGGLIKIGSKVLVGNHVTMIAANHGLKAEIPMYEQPWASSPLDVQIEDDCWIGAHATLLPGSRIQKGSVVAAGAVVTGTIPSNEIWGGIPAKKLSERPK